MGVVSGAAVDDGGGGDVTGASAATSSTRARTTSFSGSTSLLSMSGTPSSAARARHAHATSSASTATRASSILMAPCSDCTHTPTRTRTGALRFSRDSVPFRSATKFMHRPSRRVRVNVQTDGRPPSRTAVAGVRGIGRTEAAESGRASPRRCGRR